MLLSSLYVACFSINILSIIFFFSFSNGSFTFPRLANIWWFPKVDRISGKLTVNVSLSWRKCDE